MATYFSILAWRIPGTEEPDELQSMGSQKLDTTEQLTHTHITASKKNKTPSQRGERPVYRKL